MDTTESAQRVRIEPLGAGEIPGLGRWAGVNPVADPPEIAPGRVVLWSGWAGDQPGAALGVFEADFSTWGPQGRSAWDAMIAIYIDQSLRSPDARVCFRPHARHLLSDPQGCLNLLRTAGAAEGAGPFEILLEPAAMLTPDMLKTADDHVARALDSLADRADVPAILLSDVEIVEDPGRPGSSELRLVPPGAGVLGEQILDQIVSAAAAHNKPLLALEAGLGAD